MIIALFWSDGYADDRAPSPDRRIQQGGMSWRWWGMRVELCRHPVDPAHRLVKKRARDFRVLSATLRTRCQNVAGRSRCSLCWGLTIKVSYLLLCLKSTLFCWNFNTKKSSIYVNMRHLFHANYFIITFTNYVLVY